MPVVANAIEIVKDGRHGRSFFIQNQVGEYVIYLNIVPGTIKEL